MAFSTYHPVVIFSYFLVVIGFTMLLLHPVYLVITFVVAFSWYILLKRKGLKALWAFSVIFITTIIVNPLINPAGEHVLFQLGHRPITLEATLYGVAIAMLLVAAMLWFSCYNLIITSDKFLYLFGKMVPTFALTVIISLRLIPQFQRQLQKISAAQRAIGMDYTTGTMKKRLLCIARIFSILMTWALESAVETADAMKARGYGSGHKTSFSVYTFERRDRLMLIGILALVCCQVIGIGLGVTQYNFYPQLSLIAMSGSVWLFYLSYALLLSLPILIEMRESMTWHSLK